MIRLVSILGIIAILGVASAVLFKTAKLQTPSGITKTFLLPETAQPGASIISLGEAVDPVSGKLVEGFAFIDYGKRKGFAKPGTECGNNICEPSENKNNCPVDCIAGEEPAPTSQCFSFLGKGAKWKTTEPYVLDTANTDGMTAEFVASTISTSLEAWDSEAGFDIFGTRDTDATVDGIDTVKPDGKNEVLFGDIDSPGAIAVTVVWGIFRGPPSGRELVEWDQMYDDVDFDFGNAGPTSETTLGDTSIMDLQNIATHENGHSAGLGHPEDTCSEETMYRLADFGETKKRTLEAGDIAGINELY